MKCRTLVLGDIHGGLKALKQVLERCDLENDDRLIFLGDYIDGWEDSAALISYLIELNNTYECIFIRGNHDVWCEWYLTNGFASKEWVNHGGRSTIESYRKHGLDNKHISFFYKLNNYYIDDDNRLFVHGGYKSELAVNKDEPTILHWDRSLFEDSFTYSLDNESINPPDRLNLYNEIFIGHTTTFIFTGDDQPINILNIWNLDTGAGTNGRLTIMDVDTKEFWQSDPLPTLYPNDEHNKFAKLFKR